MHFSLLAEEESADSILAMISGVLVPVLKPLGLGDWRVATALISGFMAKESVVSVLNVLYAGGVAATMTALSASALLVFSLLYTPCVAAIAAIRRELGHKWALGVVLWQCGVAWARRAGRATDWQRFRRVKSEFRVRWEMLSPLASAIDRIDTLAAGCGLQLRVGDQSPRR